MKKIFSIVLVALLCTLFGCATVPREVVELSYTVGNDLSAIHASYRNLIKVHFDDLRLRVNEFFENKWVPAYLDDFIKRGELVEKARGNDPNEVLEDVQLWAEVALEEIQSKRNELLEPINNDERVLLESVDNAFSSLMNANSTITAHLNSITKVEEQQTKALELLGLKDFRDKLNNGLIEASRKAAKGIKDLEESTEDLKSMNEKKNKFMEKLKGK